MASGTIEVTSSDVFEALTMCNATTRYERVLNEDGERLADIVADRIIAKLVGKLQANEDGE